MRTSSSSPLARFVARAAFAVAAAALAACGGGGGGSALPQAGSGVQSIGGSLPPQGGAPGPGVRSTATPRPTPSPLPSFTPDPNWNPNNLPILTDASSSTSGVFLGADCGTMSAVTCPNFASTFRHGIALGTIYASWDSDLGNLVSANNFASWEAQGTIPDITWQPSSNHSTITLAGIASGQYDAYIATSAAELRSFGQPIFLRPFHEFNTTRYSWGIYANGDNATADANFIAAWQRVVTIFRNTGASNVKFVWCFNSSSSPADSYTAPAAAYPGDAYVDWVGFDGYNLANNSNGKSGSSFTSSLRGAYNNMVKVAPAKPGMIVETASNEYGDDGTMKAQWIQDMFTLLSTPAINPFPHIHAVSWFEGDNVFILDSKSTSPVYQSFATNMRSYDQNGVLAIRSNGNALFSITAP